LNNAYSNLFQRFIRKRKLGKYELSIGFVRLAQFPFQASLNNTTETEFAKIRLIFSTRDL